RPSIGRTMSTAPSMTTNAESEHQDHRNPGVIWIVKNLRSGWGREVDAHVVITRELADGRRQPQRGMRRRSRYCSTPVALNLGFGSQGSGVTRSLEESDDTEPYDKGHHDGTNSR